MLRATPVCTAPHRPNKMDKSFDMINQYVSTHCKTARHKIRYLYQMSQRPKVLFDFPLVVQSQKLSKILWHLHRMDEPVSILAQRGSTLNINIQEPL